MVKYYYGRKSSLMLIKSQSLTYILILFKLSQFAWKAGYGFHLFRPEGGGQMGGSYIAFNKNEKRTVFTGSSDQG
jgi:hypothetical protein